MKTYTPTQTTVWHTIYQYWQIIYEIKTNWYEIVSVVLLWCFLWFFSMCTEFFSQNCCEHVFKRMRSSRKIPKINTGIKIWKHLFYTVLKKWFHSLVQMVLGQGFRDQFSNDKWYAIITSFHKDMIIKIHTFCLFLLHNIGLLPI